jgi:tetratricopeptide (TPR) repeat protein
MAGGSANRRIPGFRVPLAVVALGVGITPLLGAGESQFMAGIVSDPLLGVALRASLSFNLALSAALVVLVLIDSQRANGDRPACYSGIVLGLVVLVLPPATYANARCRHDITRLGEFLEQSRFGEARTLARGLLVLDASRIWNGHSLPTVAESLDRVVRDLESRVASPLSPHASVRERVNFARDLAMLGRTEEALNVLDSVHDPDVENLRGTIHETRDEWEPALESYGRARAAWEARPPSPARSGELLRATKGIAYCQRKLGRYTDAEATYQQVLALAPTADTYFLLAQFYEDAQEAEKARASARRATELDPDRYQNEGEKLIRKLSIYQFGCLGVFNAGDSRPESYSTAPHRTRTTWFMAWVAESLGR